MGRGKNKSRGHKRGGSQGGCVGDNLGKDHQSSSRDQKFGHSGHQCGTPFDAESNSYPSKKYRGRGRNNYSESGRHNSRDWSQHHTQGSKNYRQDENVHFPQKSSSVNPQEQPEDTGDSSPESPRMMSLRCVNCCETYNDSKRVPMVLWCGHTFCKACLQTLIHNNPWCSVCNEGFKNIIRTVGDACVNYAILPAASGNTEENLAVNNEQAGGKKSELPASEKATGSDSFQKVDSRNGLKCKGCFEFYDTSSRLPRIHECGHTYCSFCVKNQIKKVHSCPSCHTPLGTIKDVKDVILNKTLCDVVKYMELNSAHGKNNESKAKEDESYGVIAINDKPIVDAVVPPDHSLNYDNSKNSAHGKNNEKKAKEDESYGAIAINDKPIVDAVAPPDHSLNYNSSKNDLVSSPQKSPHNSSCPKNGVHHRHQDNKSDGAVSHAEKPSVERHDQLSSENNLEHDIVSTPEKSPHDSNCLKNAVHPTLHCSTCQKWVCDECGRIDHPQQSGCHLIPKKVALGQVKEAQVKGAEAVVESLDSMARNLHVYEEQLEAFSLTMQAAFECSRKEKDRIKMMMENCSGRKGDVEAALLSLGNAQNLPGALGALQSLKDLSKDSLQWITSDASKTLDHSRVVRTTKEILLSSVQMRIMAEQENNAALMLLASQKVSDENLLSRMTVEGGRIFVHSLKKMDSVPHGARAIPLTSIKACLDPSSALAFFDIGWNGIIKGRVTIRLLGDTFRGRQFLMMCTGEAGPSYRNTVFHRVWWKGQPAEHIWGGDYSKGDGSGGAPVLKVSEKEKSSLLAGRPLSVCAGLLAGSFEKDEPSTLFRIYTRDDVKPVEKSPYSKEVVEVEDNSAFGRVEYGLHFLDDAVKQSNISDVTIYECGVVIET